MAFFVNTESYSEGFDTKEIKTYMGDELKREGIKVIYPFYQYGMYTKYKYQNAQFYIPGSSLKGVLCQGIYKGNGCPELMMDDLVLDNAIGKKVFVRNLYKVQNIGINKKNNQGVLLDSDIKVKEESKVNLGVFFDNVGVEMLCNGVTCNGEFYFSDSDKALNNLLSSAIEQTSKKMRKMLKQMEDVLLRSDNEFTKGTKEYLGNVYNNLRVLQEEKECLILGGYKGLFHSILISNEKMMNGKNSGIFIDKLTNLPHGLIKFKIIT